MKNQYIYSILIIMLLFACESRKVKESSVTKIENSEEFIEITQDQFMNSNMKLGVVSLQNFTETIITNGHINVPPSNRAKVSAVMGGFIKSAPLLVGDKVKKGQLLLTIENPDFIEIQQRYLEVYETLKYLKSEYERQKILYDEKITSERSFLKAESEFNTKSALFKGLEQKLIMMNLNPENVKLGKISSIIQIYSPINGSITKVNTSVGKYMATSEVLLEIIDSSHKHLELVVFEKDVLSLEIGQKIVFRIPENSKESFEAKVHLIGKSIDEENRTVQVHGHLDKETDPFLVGMFVEAEIVTNNTETFALPIEAVLEENNEYFVLVFKEKNDRAYNFFKVPVQTGKKGEDFIEITNTGNNLENSQILIKGAFVPTSVEG